MKLHTLLSHLHLLKAFNGENPEIVSVENDTRNVRQGSLFICMKGFTVDGHDYAVAAVEQGAVAVLAEKQLPLSVPVVVVENTRRAMAILADAFYNHPSKRLSIIGITGTNGKTTITHLVEKILSDAKQKTGLIGTMYTKIGDVKLETKNTTPDSLTLQKTFHHMVEENVDTVVMEVSSHALIEGRTHGVDFDTAVFTNLTQDHMDFHHTMENYAAAKSLLFSQLGNTYDINKPKYAVLNSDDATSELFKEATAAHIITYGIDTKADLQAINIHMTSQGTSFDLVSPAGVHQVLLKLLGKFNVYNVLASLAVAFVKGIALEDAIKSIEAVSGVSGRFELVDAGQPFTVIVDYSHTPDSLENALKTIKQFAKGQICVVVGCGGDRDRTKRPLMAQTAVKYSDCPIFTSDNPRSEDPEAIVKEMEAGVVGSRYTTIVDRKQAIQYAIKNANEHDVILIAGKGHETYQQIGQEKFPFDDRLVAREAIEGR